jgi:hypothetical protein
MFHVYEPALGSERIIFGVAPRSVKPDKREAGLVTGEVLPPI